MRSQWEYLVGYFEEELRQNDGDVQTNISRFTYRLPRATEALSFNETQLGDILGYFGRDGWELVSETILNTTIADTLYGWRDIGYPIRIRYVFKREVQAS